MSETHWCKPLHDHRFELKIELNKYWAFMKLLGVSNNKNNPLTVLLGIKM